jgi:hypothetical protein
MEVNMADSDKPISIAEAVHGHSAFAVYGVPVKDVRLGDFAGLVSPALNSLAYIKAYAIGDFCVRLARPLLMLVPGNGRPPEQGDKCARPHELVWQILPSEKTVALSTSVGSVSDVLDEAATRGISGGIALENPRIQNGKACVDVHIWAKIEIFGAKVGFDERFPVCIPLQGCYPVWDIGWAKLEVCFRGPNQICAQLCVGKWGLSKCWDYCVPVHVTATEAASTCECREK